MRGTGARTGENAGRRGKGERMENEDGDCLRQLRSIKKALFIASQLPL